MSDDKKDKVIDGLARNWARAGGRLANRPIQIACYMLGLIILAAALSYSMATSYTNRENIEEIQGVICRSEPPFTPFQEVRCQELLEQLLHNPLPAERERLRQLVRESKLP